MGPESFRERLKVSRSPQVQAIWSQSGFKMGEKCREQEGDMRTTSQMSESQRDPRRLPAVASAALLVALLHAAPAAASYGIYVGKNLTADGSVFLAGYGDEPSSHWLEIVPAREWPTGATIKVGATAASQYPGILIDIPQVRSTAKEHTLDHSCFAGFHP